jgi:T5SS/PEP-CTERM-associated repeat protein
MWEASGDCVIDGANDLQCLIIDFDGPGDCRLTLTTSNGNCTSDPCNFDVTIRELPACIIMGPDLAQPLEQDVQFCGPPGMVSYGWSVGPADACMIDGSSTDECVIIDFGESGICTITLDVFDGNCMNTCDKDVPILCGDGNCFNDQGPNNPGCENQECCVLVCEVDPSCCTVTWDILCATEALKLCGMCGDEGAGECDEPNGTPGCDDFFCCQFVCEIDPFCCHIGWDEVCVGLAEQICQGAAPPPAIYNGDWFDPNTWPKRDVPDQDTDAVITGTVSIDANGATAGSLEIRHGGQLEIRRGTLDVGVLTIKTGGVLTLADPETVLTVRNLVIEDGGTLAWAAGRIEMLAGTYERLGSDLVVGLTAERSTLRLDAGTRFTTRNAYVGIDGGLGAIEVAGLRTSLDLHGDLHIGFDGTGLLDISDGAMARARAATIGTHEQGVGQVTVSGAMWLVSERLEIGSSGLGELTLRHDALVAAPDVVIGPGGRLAGQGTVQGAVENVGQLEPSGPLVIDGDYWQDVPGTLTLDLSNGDALHVEGDATLSGSLVVLLPDHAELAAGETFVLVTATERHGRFTVEELPDLDGDRRWMIDYTRDGVVLRIMD